MNLRKRPAARRLNSTASMLALAAMLAAPATAVRAQAGTGEAFVPGIERDTEIEAILHDLLDPVFVAANTDPKSVELYMVDDPTLNAATFPGHRIIVNSGLIMQCDNPNQLEGVLAHETGHMERGDDARVGEMSKGMVGPMLIGLGLGVLAALAGAPDAAAGLIYSGQYFGEINGLAYSRDQESRADEAAITYLEKAGYSGKGIVDFFYKFRYEEIFSDIKKYPYWVDHPLSDERIESLAVRAKAQSHYDTPDTAQQIAEFQLLKAKIKAYMNRPYQTYMDYPESDQSFAARYARAIADYRELETDKALKELDALIVEQPNNPYLYEVKAHALMESDRAVEGEAPARKAVELNPSAQLRLLLAQDLLAENDHAKVEDAVVNLNRALVTEPDDPMSWQYLSQAYDSKGDEGMARLAAAEESFHLGQMKDARSFAMRAREFLKHGTPEWIRATDIVLSSKPSPDDLKMLGSQG